MQNAPARCQCGEVFGEACAARELPADLVVVEYMPPEHRASHEAAGNCGRWPQNGSLRLAVAKPCALLIVEANQEWAEILPDAKAQDHLPEED